MRRNVCCFTAHVLGTVRTTHALVQFQVAPAAMYVEFTAEDLTAFLEQFGHDDELQFFFSGHVAVFLL